MRLSLSQLRTGPVVSWSLEFLQHRRDHHHELGLDLTEASEGQLHGPLSRCPRTAGRGLNPPPYALLGHCELSVGDGSFFHLS